MKMIVPAVLIAALSLGFSQSAARAGCSYSDHGGYVYVHASCTQSRRYDPENICEVPEDAESIENVFFISNVIHDDTDNRRFPSGQFFDELQIQHNVTKSGSVSSCYDSRAEAIDNARSLMAQRKRHDYIIRRVDMDDS